MTLLEVIAAIAILGTILVGIVLAKSRHRRQLARTADATAAVAATEELLCAWWSGPDGVPVGAEGVMSASKPLRWRTRETPNPEIEDLGARVVRLEVFPGQAESSAAADDSEALLYVDLVLPTDEPTKEDSQEQDDASSGGESKYKVILRRDSGSANSPSAAPSNSRGIRQQDIRSVDEELQTRGRRE